MDKHSSESMKLMAKRGRRFGLPIIGSGLLGAVGFLITTVLDMQSVVLTKEQVVEIQAESDRKIMSRFDDLERKVDGHGARILRLEQTAGSHEAKLRELGRTVEDCFHDLREGRELRNECDHP